MTISFERRRRRRRRNMEDTPNIHRGETKSLNESFNESSLSFLSGLPKMENLFSKRIHDICSGPGITRNRFRLQRKNFFFAKTVRCTI
jgi:hypothetical protein